MARWHHPAITLNSASCRWSQISGNWLRLAAIGSDWQLPGPMVGDPYGHYYLLS